MGKIRILLVDDDKELLDITRIYLEKIEDSFQIVTASSVKEALELIENDLFDVIVCDYQMPEANGLDFLALLRDQEYDLPFIIFTGRGREEVAIQALNLGADFYLQKGGDVQSQFSELINLIKKSIEKRNAETALRVSEEKFSKAFQFSFNCIFITKLNNAEIIDININFSKILHYTKDDVIGKSVKEIKLWVKLNDYNVFEKNLLDNGEVVDFETLLLAKNSKLIPVQISATLIDIEGEPCALFVARDISELSATQEALRENELKYRTLFEDSPIALVNFNLFDIRTKIKQLPKDELDRFLSHGYKNPNIIIDFISSAKLNEINRAGLELFGSLNIMNFSNILSIDFITKNFDIFKAIFEFLFSNDDIFEGEFTFHNLMDKELQVLIRISYATGAEDTWSNILISMIDITKSKIAQESLQRERKAFNILSNAAINSSSIEELCKEILSGLMETLCLDFGSIRLIDKQRMKYTPCSIVGLSDKQKELFGEMSIDDEHKLVDLLHRKEIVFIQDTDSYEDLKDSVLILEFQIKSYIFCPILNSKNELIGSIQMGSKKHSNLNEEDKVFFTIITNILSSIIIKMQTIL